MNTPHKNEPRKPEPGSGLAFIVGFFLGIIGVVIIAVADKDQIGSASVGAIFSFLFLVLIFACNANANATAMIPF